MIHKSYFKINILISIILNSCLYKASNRQADLNFSVPVNINTFYVDSYVRQNLMKSIYESPVNSELVNYPKDFVPLTDSLNELKYVVELRVSGDSSKNDGSGLILSSIYDFKKSQWIVERDSLRNGEYEKFKTFFKGTVLAKVINEYKNKIPDSLLFISNPGNIIFKSAK